MVQKVQKNGVSVFGQRRVWKGGGVPECSGSSAVVQSSNDKLLFGHRWKSVEMSLHHEFQMCPEQLRRGLEETAAAAIGHSIRGGCLSILHEAEHKHRGSSSSVSFRKPTQKTIQHKCAQAGGGRGVNVWQEFSANQTKIDRSVSTLVGSSGGWGGQMPLRQGCIGRDGG